MKKSARPTATPTNPPYHDAVLNAMWDTLDAIDSQPKDGHGRRCDCDACSAINGARWVLDEIAQTLDARLAITDRSLQRDGMPTRKEMMTRKGRALLHKICGG